MKFELFTEAELFTNYENFRSEIRNRFPTRATELDLMYDAIGDQLIVAPASSYEHFHNAFPGGYIDHVLRVVKFSKVLHRTFELCGLITNDFTEEELLFAAFHHDLGKVGLPGFDHYNLNQNKWSVENTGKIYDHDMNKPWMDVTDQGFYLLNKFGVKYSLAEMIGIKLTDGMYSESNKPYYTGFNLNTKLRSNIGYILHHADLMAYRFEFERYVKVTDGFKFGYNV